MTPDDSGPVAQAARSTERRTQAERRAQSDREMMRAATRLIATYGASGVSMALIGTEAGYSRGLPAERYGSKTRLLEAVVDATDGWFQRRLEARLQGKRGLTALRERVRAHIETVRDQVMPTIALYQLIIESVASVPDIRPRIVELNRSYWTAIAGDLEQAIADGEVDPDLDTRRRATQITGAMHGYSVQFLIEPESVDMNAAIVDLTTAMIDAIDRTQATTASPSASVPPARTSA
ncbi:MAG: TetR/AcrR family transcriptional regulator [Pseudomonadota bacterium]|nr:TetR/AcrR family transcriptional regulator [Pseudomonadota bacterium]